MVKDEQGVVCEAIMRGAIRQMSEKSFVIQMIYGVIEAQINFETEHHSLIERRS